MARFTDAWARAQFAPDLDRFTVETPPDPGHGDMSEPSNAVVMQDAPVLQGGGEIVTDALFECYQHLPPAVEIDKTPVGGHGTVRDRGHGYGGTTQPLGAAEGYGRAVMGSERGDDRGADRRATGQVGRPWRKYNEQWFGLTTIGMGRPPITDGPGDDVLRRGLNAYPENDGPGGRQRGNGSSSWTVNNPSYKPGLYQSSNVNRDFSPPHRTHRMVRMNRPDVVTIIGNAPPPDKPTKYDSPFTSLQQFGLNIAGRRRPGMRRVPGPWDEALVATAPTQSVPTGAADGMVVP